LRKLRDQLAVEAPRARTRPHAPPDIVQRLNAALELVSRVYLLTAAPSGTIDEVLEDAVVEATLVISEWQRWLDEEKKKPAARPRAMPSIDQRQHERFDVNVAVRLLRHSLRDDGTGGGVTLDSATSDRAARNISLGGMFVAVPPKEFTHVGVGSIVHVSVSTPLGGNISFHARAAVTRRDAAGLALRWMDDAERTRAAIAALVDAVRDVKPR
jgi:hypothetical protein